MPDRAEQPIDFVAKAYRMPVLPQRNLTEPSLVSLLIGPQIRAVLTSAEARSLAAALNDMADVAEGPVPRSYDPFDDDAPI